MQPVGGGGGGGGGGVCVWGPNGFRGTILDSFSGSNTLECEH